MGATKLDFSIEDLQLSPSMKDLPIIAKYDEAVRELLSQVFAGSVILAPQDRAFELYVNQEKDKVHFPFISIFPVQSGYIRVNRNYMQSNIGDPINRAAYLFNKDTLAKEGRTNLMQNFYQVQYYNIPYAIECWSTNRIQALQLVQELCFWLQSQGEVLVRYKDHNYTANMTVGDTIADNTAYNSYSDLGSIYRFTIQINIEAPVFRTQNYLNLTKGKLEINLKDDEENTDARKD